MTTPSVAWREASVVSPELLRQCRSRCRPRPRSCSMATSAWTTGRTRGPTATTPATTTRSSRSRCSPSAPSPCARSRSTSRPSPGGRRTSPRSSARRSTRRSCRLGSKIGLDATDKWPPETRRAWGRTIRMSEEVIEQVSRKWADYGLPGSGEAIWK